MTIASQVRRMAHRGLLPQTISARTGLSLPCVEAILRGRPWRHLVNLASGDLLAHQHAKKSARGIDSR